jgi:hypothetical protein
MIVCGPSDPSRDFPAVASLDMEIACVHDAAEAKGAACTVSIGDLAPIAASNIKTIHAECS